jgi:3-methylcrotonyl-CoA carboxylase alpha subunit
MIAKVIVHGADRQDALTRLSSTLGGCRIAGCMTNLNFLGALVHNEGFARGDVDTHLIDRDLATLATAPDPGPMITAFAAVAARGLISTGVEGDPWSALRAWRQWSAASLTASLEYEGHAFESIVLQKSPGAFTVKTGDVRTELQVALAESGDWLIQSGNARLNAGVVSTARTVVIFAEGLSWVFSIPDPLESESEFHAGGDAVFAPMPGLVKAVRAVLGNAVRKGEPLMVLEAMKMEHTLTAPRDGVVDKIIAEDGQQVREGALLIRIVDDSDSDGNG